MRVVPIDRHEASHMILDIHYAGRWPSVSHLFGLFDNEDLIGCISYGTPPSAPLRSGIAGRKWVSNVLELNRLVLINNNKNEASFLVGRSLRLLPHPSIVVSYADTAQGHVGYVYQATNFLYTGLSAKRTDWKIRGMEHLHGQTVADMSRGQKDRAAYMREKFGDRFYLAPRPRKHRYIYIVANKRDKKPILADLRYPILPYPKVSA